MGDGFAGDAPVMDGRHAIRPSSVILQWLSAAAARPPAESRARRTREKATPWSVLAILFNLWEGRVIAGA